jgi:N-acetylmuramoyl-L-alanine amidase
MPETRPGRKISLRPVRVAPHDMRQIKHQMSAVQILDEAVMSQDPDCFGRRAVLRLGLAAALLLPAGWNRGAAARAAPGRGAPPLVFLDPGHGGKDPGAIGVSGTHEKTIALAVALELRRQLQAGARYRVELSRTRDIFVPLAGRVARAQARGAALFISLHADSVNDRGVRGASVYTLAAQASDAQTAALARRENAADRFGGPRFADVPPEIGRILASLVRQETRVGSVRMAGSLVRSLDRDIPMLPNPARHAGFVVLQAADIPSVLVEMGFMSNRADEAALRKAAHRARVAAAIRRAVDGFFSGGPYMAGTD